MNQAETVHEAVGPAGGSLELGRNVRRVGLHVVVSPPYYLGDRNVVIHSAVGPHERYDVGVKLRPGAFGHSVDTALLVVGNFHDFVSILIPLLDRLVVLDFEPESGSHELWAVFNEFSNDISFELNVITYPNSQGPRLGLFGRPWCHSGRLLRLSSIRT